MGYEIQSSEACSFRVPGVNFLMYLEFSGNISDLPSLDVASVFINRGALNHPEEFRRLILKSGLGRWPLSEEHRCQIANIAILTALESLQRMPWSSEDHNYFSFRFHVSDHEEIRVDLGNLERKKPSAWRSFQKLFACSARTN